MKICHVVNISGGKDSQATAILAKSRLPKDARVKYVFADTQHEASVTYEFLDYMEESMGIKIERVKRVYTDAQFWKRKKSIVKRWKKDGVSRHIILRAIQNMNRTNNAFLDMSLLRGGFPSPMVKFCTENLKVVPVLEQVIQPILDDGYHIIQWLGVRRDESRRRAETPLFNKDLSDDRIMKFYPIRNWTEEDVFKYIDNSGYKHNPLYDMGAGRVGCWPCIHAKKDEVKLVLNSLDGESLDRMKEWEERLSLVSKKEVSPASFFQCRTKFYKDRYKNTGEPQRIEEQKLWSEGNNPLTDFEERQNDLDEILKDDDCDDIGYCE